MTAAGAAGATGAGGAAGTGAGTGLRRALAGLRWYLREVSGESRWDAYVDRCRAEGRAPVSRRDFERHRADQREHHSAQRCC